MSCSIKIITKPLCNMSSDTIKGAHFGFVYTPLNHEKIVYFHFSFLIYYLIFIKYNNFQVNSAAIVLKVFYRVKYLFVLLLMKIVLGSGVLEGYTVHHTPSSLFTSFWVHHRCYEYVMGIRYCYTIKVYFSSGSKFLNLICTDLGCKLTTKNIANLMFLVSMDLLYIFETQDYISSLLVSKSTQISL